MSGRCLVTGVGKMGLAHLQTLVALRPKAVAGWAPSMRRRESVEAVGAQMLEGPLEEALHSFNPTHVIVASPVETLALTSITVMRAGVKYLLVEKPVVLSAAEGKKLAETAAQYGATIHVGYNRRFYCSVRTALRCIRDAGEHIESVLFEFNEAVADPAGPTGHVAEVRARWLLANSLHVIDTAFLPVGHPDPQKSCYVHSGGLRWHPAGSVYAGVGETVQGVPFAYHANWNGPGRWGVEWITPSARYVFRPIEKLAMMKKGSFALEEVAIDDELDRCFKPGVYLQDKAFLEGDKNAGLVTLAEALSLIPLGARIGGYPDCEAA